METSFSIKKRNKESNRALNKIDFKYFWRILLPKNINTVTIFPLIICKLLISGQLLKDMIAERVFDKNLRCSSYLSKICCETD